MSDSWRFALIAVGAALILGAFVWRFVRSSRGSKQLSRALRDPDPLVRRAAIEVMSERGIGDYASALRPLVNAEPDASVLDALALAITRNQWEPADNRKLVELRLWAKARNEAAELREDAAAKETVAVPVVDVAAPPVAVLAPVAAIESIPPVKVVAPVPVPVVDTSSMIADAQREADLIVERARATARAIEAAARAERVQVLEKAYAEVEQLIAVSRDGHNAVLADARTLLDKFLSGDSDLSEDPRTHSGQIEIHEIPRLDVDEDDDDDESAHDDEQRVVIVIRQEPSTKKKKK